MIEIGRIAFVGVDVNFKLARRIGPHEQILKHRAARGRSDPQIHAVAIFHAVKLSVVIVHVDVPLRANQSFLQFNNACWADENAARRPLDVPASLDGQFDAKGYGIGESQFHLAGLACRAEDTDRGEHLAFVWPDNHDRFFGGIEPVLVQVFVRRELAAFAKQDLHVLIREMAMPR